MIVWGGGSHVGSPLGTGAVYEPRTDGWRPMRTFASGARAGHTAVWTGSRMVVWGGTPFPDGFEGVAFDSGGQYDPAADTWTETSRVGAPAARKHHTAVWTGTRMIVWGGDGSCELPVSSVGGTCGYLDSGGIYDPATDAWTPMSSDGAPAGRTWHTAVWTGTRMIVWGGFGNDGSFLDSGGVYDPATDTWTPMSTLGAPAGRCSHTAVWTGSRMIVWGGTAAWQGVPFMDTGGVYDPTTDTWLATSLTGAPAPRIAHTAVWTRAGMIVWGGLERGQPDRPLSTGAVYKPATDTWSSGGVDGGPAARLTHTAVWTGSRMIVWGGHDTRKGLVSGGIYALFARNRRPPHGPALPR
jgi:Kelch motif